MVSFREVGLMVRRCFVVRRFIGHSAVGVIAVGMLSLSAVAARATENTTQTVVSDLVVVLIDQASITSATEGTVRQVNVQEGDSVQTNDLIVQLDDEKSQSERSLAERALQIAEQRRDAKDALEAAKATVAEREQLITEHTVRREVNRQQATNDLKVQAAEKAEAVAQNEWMRAKNARQNFSDAVSESEIESLRLAFERTRLETLEAKFQLEMAQIDVRLDEAAAETLRLKRQTALVELEAARSAGQEDSLKAEIEALQLDLADNRLAAHHLRTPIGGTVVTMHVRVGDWVRPGQIVARVINTKRLRVEGFAKALDAETLRQSNEIRILVSQPGGGTVEVPGGSKFVSPEIDAVTGEVRFWIEFDNIGGIYPGSNARVEIR